MSSAAPPSMPPQPPEEVYAPPAGADEVPRGHGGFWADPRVAPLAGMGTSILLHAIIIIGGLLLIPKVRETLVDLVTVEEQNIIPTAELSEQPGGLQNPGMNNDATRAAAQAVDANVTQSDGWASQKSENLTQTLESSAAGDANVQIGLSSKAAGKSGKGLGNSSGDLGKFGVPGGGQGIGPKGAVFGNGGNAIKIVFIVDATGSMNDGRWLVVKRELLATVGKLKPVQQFSVILFRDDSFVSLDRSLIDASTANKKKLEDFLNAANASGGTKPIEAVETAMRMKPDLVYLLVDPFIFDTMKSQRPIEDLTQAFSKSKSAHTKVNFIMFHVRAEAKKEPALKPTMDALTKMAKDLGGSFTNVSMEEVFK